MAEIHTDADAKAKADAADAKAKAEAEEAKRKGEAEATKADAAAKATVPVAEPKYMFVNDTSAFNAARFSEAMAQAEADELDETVPGGVYKVGSSWVDANGEPVQVSGNTEPQNSGGMKKLKVTQK